MMSDTLTELRQRARPLLDLYAARDALAAYYALHHDPKRTRLLIEEDRSGHVEGFLAICQTGQDLFRPTAVLRALNVNAARALLQRGLEPRRPYYLVTSIDLASIVEEKLTVTGIETNRIYRLDPGRYRPQINVLVMAAPAPGGAQRFVIRARDNVAAEAGINWRSSHFAEVYVWVAPEARGRGWGRAVLESCVAWVVRSGLQPLYVVAESNAPSIRLAESVGFVDTHAREFAAEGVLVEKG